MGLFCVLFVIYSIFLHAFVCFGWLCLCVYLCVGTHVYMYMCMHVKVWDRCQEYLSISVYLIEGQVSELKQELPICACWWNYTRVAMTIQIFVDPGYINLVLMVVHILSMKSSPQAPWCANSLKDSNFYKISAQHFQ